MKFGVRHLCPRNTRPRIPGSVCSCMNVLALVIMVNTTDDYALFDGNDGNFGRHADREWHGS